MSDTTLSTIRHLYQQTFGTEAMEIWPLKRTASGRHYFRIQAEDKSYIGTYGSDPKENEAFVTFSKHFKSKNLAVPEICGVDLQQGIYIQEDLGTESLYDRLQKNKEEDFDSATTDLYKKVLSQLALLQIKGGEGLDYSKCTPCSDFDRQSMQWDLNYCKYFFLKLTGIGFDEEALERDFQTLMDYLLEEDSNHFMFRDFQSRNIMIRNEEPWFIDYQGGRRGALQYDVASLLYQPAANMSASTREALLQHYLDEVAALKRIDKERFLAHFYGYVLMRRLQTLGTYGLRGIHERYTIFLKFIPIALQQITTILEQEECRIALPELKRVLTVVKDSGQFEVATKQKNKLTVTVNSFSYKRAIPDDPSGNGGGFVFDCRFLNNPGRYEAYKKLTGKDEAVIEFLQAHSNMGDFLNNVFFLVDEAVQNYIERDFDHLMVSFGCTGGQHRSVYAAERLAKHLEERFGVNVVLRHLEQEINSADTR